MQITIQYSETYNLSQKQIDLLKRLNKHAEYLHNEEADLADETPGVYDTGESKYDISYRGKLILTELSKLKVI